MAERIRFRPFEPELVKTNGGKHRLTGKPVTKIEAHLQRGELFIIRKADDNDE